MSQPSAYTLRISEEQRAALLALLNQHGAGTSESDADPLCYWQSMLRQLPKDEAEQPGIMHGFCL